MMIKKQLLVLKKKVVALCACALMTFAPMGAANAAVCPPYAEAITISVQAAMQAALNALVDALFNAFTSQLNLFAQMKSAALRVVNNQIVMSNKALMQAENFLAKGEVSAITLLETTKQQLHVYENYSPETGQGVDPCGQLARQKAVVLATGQALAQAAEMVGKVQAAPGRFGSSANYLAGLEQANQGLLTEDEVALGYGGTVAPVVKTRDGSSFSLQGAGTNAAVLFVDSDDERVAQAKQTFLEYVAGMPVAPLSPASAKTAAGMQVLADKNRKDAIMSVALNSLAQVATENTASDELNGESKISAMTDMANMYFGESARETWRAWMAQSNRGLMVDSLKIESSTMSVEMDLLEQSRRQEALLGALLSARADQAKAEAAMSASRVAERAPVSAVP